MRFRRELILVPLMCLAAAWVLHSIEPACNWHDVMHTLHVRNEEQYTHLAVLGCGLVALVATLRVLRKKDGET